MTIQTYLHQPKVSSTLLINEQSALMEKSGQDIYRFGFGQSPFSPPKFLQDELAAHRHEHGYLPIQGLAELREAVADFHKKNQNLDYSADEVYIGPGSKQLIFNVLALFKKARVYLPAPTWVSYEPQCDILNHDTHYIESTYETNWRLTPELLEAELSKTANDEKANIIILTYPGNPTGLTYSGPELEGLAAVLKKYNVLVISDEIYGCLTFNRSHQSIAKYYKEQTIITTGLSKWCGAGGWRVGTALVPKALGSDFHTALSGIGSETYSSHASPIQYAAIEAYNNDESLTFINQQIDVLSVLGKWCSDQLNNNNVRVHAPEGAFYLWIDFSQFKTALQAKGINDSAKLCEKLLSDAGVALLPGTAFGMKKDLYVARLAYVNFDGNKTLEAVANGKTVDESFVKELCPRVVTGIERINQFVNAL